MRYEIHTGKFGCYFYDTLTDKDVTLDEALNIMNNNILKEDELTKEIEKLRFILQKSKSALNCLQDCLEKSWKNENIERWEEFCFKTIGACSVCHNVNCKYYKK